MRGSIKKDGNSWYVVFDLGKILLLEKGSKKEKEDLKHPNQLNITIG